MGLFNKNTKADRQRKAKKALEELQAALEEEIQRNKRSVDQELKDHLDKWDRIDSVQEENERIGKKRLRLQNKAALGGLVVGGGVGLGVSHLATKSLRKKIKELKAKPKLSVRDEIKIKDLKAKIALIKIGSTGATAIGGSYLGNRLADRYNQKHNPYKNLI